MDHLIKKLEECLNEKLLKITVSNPRRAEEIKKYNIRPVLLRNRLAFQVESHTKTQVFHENLEKNGTLEKLREILPLYKQVQIQTVDEEVTALINKKAGPPFGPLRRNRRQKLFPAAKGLTGSLRRLSRESVPRRI